MITGLVLEEVLIWSMVHKESQLRDSSGLTINKSYSEEDLINGCKNNNRELQKKLYKRYFGKMMSIARRYIKNHEDALEVVNNGFLKIFTNLDQFRGTGSFESWMSRIMVNTALDQFRANKAYSTAMVFDEEFEKKFDKLFETSEFEDIDIDRLLQMIDLLPPMCKAIFNLYAIDGYSHKEIASKLKISVGNSKAQLSFARSKLKDMLLKTKNKNQVS